ncbi:hypothetical protein NDU88_005681 [Pleurodeles waltl]|uniref:Uncharacterized protein n=1 Tax=Pleurodeles waltl TaxID=8319 RepID=A0AAV7WZ91_PLEWA|nr:hypothetical protein NDU88_005681 [Pleurodeles waltl]
MGYPSGSLPGARGEITVKRSDEASATAKRIGYPTLRRPYFRCGVRLGRNHQGQPPNIGSRSRPWPRRRRRPTKGGQGASALSRTGRTGEGAAPAEDPRGQLLAAEPPRPLSRSGPEAHQLGCGRAGERNSQSTSLDGGDPSDRREEARASSHRGQKGPGEDLGNPSRRHSEAAQLPVRAAGSDGRRLRPHWRSSVPGDSPKDRAPRS